MFKSKLNKPFLSVFGWVLYNIHKKFFKFFTYCAAFITNGDKVIAVYGKALCGPAFTAFDYFTKHRTEIIFFKSFGNYCGIYAYFLAVGSK